ncbi:MAG TPA: GNAT family N-acetyltransferase [Candidatus Binataceae bacterium]|nr:GNAT family N-acetyltransferase [Candidatus Binataceae bacterium]
MDASEIRVVAADAEPLRQAVYGIRRRVFIEEQSVPEAIELDEDDTRAFHVAALAGEHCVGCARMLPNRDHVKIGRMAVEREWRRRGVGRCMLDFMLQRARALGYRRAALHAQLHAEGFYLKAGFTPVGGVFHEAGIPHRRMERDL